MTIPLRHFLIGLILLLVAVTLAVGMFAGILDGFVRLAYLHLLLAGWICLTIMGAMTQFVPVWSGTDLHSRRLASVQLFAVAIGVSGMGVGFLTDAFQILAASGGVVLLGFWIFSYNIGRTVLTQDAVDVTLGHFLVALGYLLTVPVFGLLLALDFLYPLFPAMGVSHSSLLGAHATLAVFGVIVTTIYGALYQLGTMFTQTELHGSDHLLQKFELLAHPAGVLVLATGRLFDVPWIGKVGGLGIALGALAFGSIIVRKLYEMQVVWTPMHRRYAVAMGALIGWAVLALPAWLLQPTARSHLFGAPGTAHFLIFGVIGFVILGTLYHIIPFIIWVHEYSDRLGFEQVPMIDDLYDDRLALGDLFLVTSGVGLLVGADLLGPSGPLHTVAACLILAGVVVFITNMIFVLHNHGPHSIGTVLLGWANPNRFFRSSSGVEE